MCPIFANSSLSYGFLPKVRSILLLLIPSFFSWHAFELQPFLLMITRIIIFGHHNPVRRRNGTVKIADSDATIMKSECGCEIAYFDGFSITVRGSSCCPRSRLCSAVHFVSESYCQKVIIDQPKSYWFQFDTDRNDHDDGSAGGQGISAC